MNTKTILAALSVTAAYVLVSASATAAVIAKYDFNSSTFANSATVPSGLTVSALTPGTLLGTNGSFATGYSTEGAASYAITSAGLATGNTSTGPAFAIAATNGSYLEFTLTPATGQSFSLTDLHLDVGRDSSSTGAGSYRLAVTSSLTGYAYGDQIRISTEPTADFNSIPGILQGTLGGSFAVVPSGLNANWGQSQNTIIDLSGASFQSISSSVTFRIYAFSISPNVIGNLRLDNIFVNGAVIPEPSSYALIAGFLGLTVVTLRRRR